MIPKAYAYIVREREGSLQLLVFAHRDFPDAGFQVPGGSIDDGESPEIAVLREVEEESGLHSLHMERKLAVIECYSPENDQWHERHYFLFVLAGDTPDSWQHVVSSGEEDKGLVYCYEWWPLEKALGRLAAGRDEVLSLLITT